ncbi:hypothetical protein LINPERHAP2_LOCUS32371, partial [Linum perenne]
TTLRGVVVVVVVFVLLWLTSLEREVAFVLLWLTSLERKVAFVLLWLTSLERKVAFVLLWLTSLEREVGDADAVGGQENGSWSRSLLVLRLLMHLCMKEDNGEADLDLGEDVGLILLTILERGDASVRRKSSFSLDFFLAMGSTGLSVAVLHPPFVEFSASSTCKSSTEYNYNQRTKKSSRGRLFLKLVSRKEIWFGAC